MTEQRTQEWYEKRKGRITGSVVGAILGLCPWRKPDGVLRAMVREHHGAPSEFVGGPHIDHGNNNEQRALLAFMRDTGLGVDQCGFFEYGDRMGASPDGLTSDGGVLELKVPYSLRNGGEFKPLADQPHYAAQVQMELLATGRSHAYFAQYIAPKGDPLAHDYVPEQIHIERVEADPEWIDRVLPELDAFYKRYLAELDNPEHLEPPRQQLDTAEAAQLVAIVDSANDRIKAAEQEKKDAMAALTKMADGKSSEIFGRKLTKVVRKGNVQYAKIPELKGVDLERFRGKESVSWRLT